MGIPTIEPYPMPGDADLPENLVRWRPDRSRVALLVHDMQNYFVDFFPDGRAPRRELLSNGSRLLHAARAAGVPVAYTAQPGNMTREQRGLLHDVWGPGMGDDPKDTGIVAGLTPAGDENVVTKWRYSAFAWSDLGQFLAGNGRDQLIVCGVYAHVGCLMTVCDAFTLDIQPFLVADAVADFTPAYHRLALDYAAQRCAAVVSTADVVTRLTDNSVASAA